MDDLTRAVELYRNSAALAIDAGRGEKAAAAPHDPRTAGRRRALMALERVAVCSASDLLLRNQTWGAAYGAIKRCINLEGQSPLPLVTPNS